MAASNMPPGYSDEGDAPSCGRDTAIWVELQNVRNRFRAWMFDHRNDVPNTEMASTIELIDDRLKEISDELAEL